MLYDNGPLLALYAQAALATGEDLFARIASETADWLLADMLAPNGGFYSTRDADSEGEEGRFYVWTPEEIRRLLASDEFAVLARRFGLDEDANFEGSWHLAVRQAMRGIADDVGKSREEVTTLLETARQKLLVARAERVHPERDEKQLTSWNALAIRGLAIASNALQRTDLVDVAANAIEFLRDKLFPDGRLRASFKDGDARFPAYLDDHAFLLDAILETLQARWRSAHLEFAIELAELLIDHFYDHDNGGFFFTADDHETLMHRPKPLADEAMPSGNGIAAFALQRLGFLLGEARYLVAAETTLKMRMACARGVSAWPRVTDHGARGTPGTTRRSSSFAATVEDIGQLAAPARRSFMRRDGWCLRYRSDETDLPGALADRSARVTGETDRLPLRRQPLLTTHHQRGRRSLSS